MTKPTRFEVNGERHYATDRADKSYPSVTTILGATSWNKHKEITKGSGDRSTTD